MSKTTKTLKNKTLKNKSCPITVSLKPFEKEFSKKIKENKLKKRV